MTIPHQIQHLLHLPQEKIAEISSKLSLIAKAKVAELTKTTVGSTKADSKEEAPAQNVPQPDPNSSTPKSTSSGKLADIASQLSRLAAAIGDGVVNSTPNTEDSSKDAIDVVNRELKSTKATGALRTPSILPDKRKDVSAVQSQLSQEESISAKVLKLVENAAQMGDSDSHKENTVSHKDKADSLNANSDTQEDNSDTSMVATNSKLISAKVLKLAENAAQMGDSDSHKENTDAHMPSSNSKSGKAKLNSFLHAHKAGNQAETKTAELNISGTRVKNSISSFSNPDFSELNYKAKKDFHQNKMNNGMRGKRRHHV